nr:hypothetical protein [Neobacillus sp. Marseille-Q6967]
MDIGVIVILISIVIYLLIMFKNKMIEKKERKWVFLMLTIVIGLSLMTSFNISLNFIIKFFSNTFGEFTRMVVKV